MTQNGEVLARFHRTLVEEIRAKRPEYLEGPFTVAEIYQNLVPYGTHRDRLGVDMNGDYEHALLRLLSGEGGYLVLESDAALRALREEIDSSNPNTGLYREFAAVDVHLDPARLMVALPEGVREVHLPEFEMDEPDVPEDGNMVMDLDDGSGPEEEPEAAAPAAERGDHAAAASCKWCRAELPDRPNLRFCPFCGTDVHLVPCPQCGEEIEPNWRFCIACGTEVTG